MTVAIELSSQYRRRGRVWRRRYPTKDPTTNSASGGEAAFTDVRLIGDCCSFSGPAFAPTATLAVGPISGTITGIIMTLSMAGFGGQSSPVDGPNSIVIDGMAVPTSFLGGFGAFDDTVNPNIETRSVALSSSFFSLFADGSINLTGTHISEQDGARSFQVDYLKFDITTSDTAVPEPSTFGLLGAGLGIATMSARHKGVRR